MNDWLMEFEELIEKVVDNTKDWEFEEFRRKIIERLEEID